MRAKDERVSGRQVRQLFDRGGVGMRSFAVIVLAVVTLAACGERAEPVAPTPVEDVSALKPDSEATASVPLVLTTDQLSRVCQAGLAAIHGQGVTDIQIEGLEGRIVNASWRAPVDGGRRRAQCRVEGDLVNWKPVEATGPDESRWMNQVGDPVTRFMLDGDAVAINTTLPDGRTTTEEYSLAEGEVRS